MYVVIYFYSSYVMYVDCRLRRTLLKVVYDYFSLRLTDRRAWFCMMGPVGRELAAGAESMTTILNDQTAFSVFVYVAKKHGLTAQMLVSASDIMFGERNRKQKAKLPTLYHVPLVLVLVRVDGQMAGR